MAQRGVLFSSNPLSLCRGLSPAQTPVCLGWLGPPTRQVRNCVGGLSCITWLGLVGVDSQQPVTTGDSVRSRDCLSTCCRGFITCCRTVRGWPGSAAGRASLWFSEGLVPKGGWGNGEGDGDGRREGADQGPGGRECEVPEAWRSGRDPWGVELERAAYPLSLVR